MYNNLSAKQKYQQPNNACIDKQLINMFKIHHDSSQPETLQLSERLFLCKKVKLNAPKVNI